MERFGEKLRTLRRRHKMSQQRLATIVGLGLMLLSVNLKQVNESLHWS